MTGRILVSTVDAVADRSRMAWRLAPKPVSNRKVRNVFDPIADRNLANAELAPRRAPAELVLTERMIRAGWTLREDVAA